MPTEDPAELIVSIITQGEPALIIVDALDEAINDQEARTIASKLLRPLALDGAGSEIKVLVGTRPGHQNEFLHALGERSIINLDDTRYFDLADLTSYARQCLQADPRPGQESSYRNDTEVAELVAQAIAGRAQPSFLVAGLTARTRAVEPLIDTTQDSWRESQRFPQDVTESMADYLSRLPDPDRALHFLIPLAFSHYPGLPLSLWEQVVTSYSGIPCKHAEMERLLRGAASYVVEQRTIDGEIVYRLFHQALVEYIRDRVQAKLVNETFLEVLKENARSRGGWPTADTYGRRNVATHAAEAGNNALDDLLDEAGFLVGIDRTDLLRAFASLRRPSSLATAALYRSAAHKLSQNVGVNAAYLELAAYSHNNLELAARIRDLLLDQPFAPIFVLHETSPGYLTLRSDDNIEGAMAWGNVDGRAVLASGNSDSIVRIWDPTGGIELFEPVYAEEANFLTFGQFQGRTSLASAGWNYVQLWNPISGEELAKFHNSSIWIRSVAWGKVNGRTSLAITTDDSIIFWDPVSGTSVGKFTGHTNIYMAEWGKLRGKTVVVLATVGWLGPSIHVWEASTQRTLYSLRSLSESVTALTWIEWKDRPAIAIATGGKVLVWDVSNDEEPSLVANFTIGISGLSWLNREGGLLAIATYDGIIHIHDPESATELSRFRAHYGMIRSIEWCGSDERQLLASTGEDHALHIWNPRSSERPSSAPGNDAWVNSVAWGEIGDRKVLATGGHDGLIQVWDPASGTNLTVFTAHESAVHALAWGQVAGLPVLASGGDDGTVRIWDPLKKQEVSRFSGHHDAINSIAWQRIKDRAVLASASDDGTIFVWDALEGNKNVLLKVTGEWGEPVFGWITQGESAMLVIGGLGEFIEIWDPLTASKVGQFPAGEIIQKMSCIEASGRTFVAATANAFALDADTSVQIWDAGSGKEIRAFSVPGDIISGLAWGKVNQRCVLSYSTEDGDVYIYDIDRDDYSVFRCDAAVIDIDLTNNGFLAIGHSKGVEALVLSDHWLNLGKPNIRLSLPAD